MRANSFRGDSSGLPQLRSDSVSARWRAIAVVAVFLLAIVARLYYVTHAVVINPVRADASEYVAYAHNLAFEGTFGRTAADAAPVVADSFRDPGYPLLLALFMRAAGPEGDWYPWVLLMQAVLGAASVILALYLGWRWLGARYCVAATTLMALWPHLVTMPSFLLSETLYSFLLLAALAALVRARQTISGGWALIAGLAFAMAALTNAVAILIAPMLALALMTVDRTQWRLYSWVLLAWMIPVSIWQVRNASLEHASSSGSRVAMNLIQGSWPDYHDAYVRSIQGDPTGRSVMVTIDREVTASQGRVDIAASIVGKRIIGSPFEYLIWYASKPYLLWDWRVRMGQNDVYIYPTVNSPFDTSVTWRIFIALCKALNPFLFILAASASVTILARRKGVASVSVALVAVYSTVVHVVLQAEPRYSIPLRPFECLLALSALAWLVRATAQLRTAKSVTR